MGGGFVYIDDMIGYFDVICELSARLQKTLEPEIAKPFCFFTFLLRAVFGPCPLDTLDARKVHSNEANLGRTLVSTPKVEGFVLHEGMFFSLFWSAQKCSKFLTFLEQKRFFDHHLWLLFTLSGVYNIIP